MQAKQSGADRTSDIITVDGISKTFSNGVVALNDFTAHIRRSEVVVVIGPSGSGKSTLLRCLNGLEDIDSGSIVVDGIPLDDNKNNRLEIRKRRNRGSGRAGAFFQSPPGGTDPGLSQPDTDVNNKAPS